MKDFGILISQLRRERRMSQDEFAKLIGCTKQTISNYERNMRKPDYETLEAIADVLNVPMSFFLSEEEQREKLARIYRTYDMHETRSPLPPNLRRISEMQPQSVPVIGSVAAGVPILAEQEYDIYIDSPVKADFALTVEGDSMEPTYLSGDTVFIREQPDVLDGQIAVVIIDDSAALKHVYHIKGGLQLVSENPKYPPMLVMAKDCDYLHILGLAVGFCRLHRYA